MRPYTKQTVIHNKSGLGLGSLIFILFLALKLTGEIDWSWWWVTAPLWIPLAIIILLVVVIPLVILLFVSIFGG